MNVYVLGAGLVGKAMAMDLAEDPALRVTSVDRDETTLEAVSVSDAVATVQADLGKATIIASVVSDADLVVSAVPGFMGFQTLESLIRARKNVVDISFFAEDAFRLDGLARENGVTAVVDCGVAPGLCNIIAGDVYRQLDDTERYECYVGGLPERPDGPFKYRAVFSPVDVLQEYIRPARLRLNGEIIVRPALSDVELREFPGVGTLEAFNTDGLRSLLKTLDVPDMKEKTLRYPGHADLMRTFRDSGFFGQNEILLGDNRLRPIDVTASLLIDAWRLGSDERDFTVMQVVLEGMRSGKRFRYTYDLLDRCDPVSGVHSMARTTGYTATTVARLVLDGTYSVPGISPPEFLGRQEGILEKVTAGLNARNISISETITSDP